MDPRINIITLGVKDLSRSRRFYGEELGFPISKMSNDAIVFFKTRGVCLALYPIKVLAEDAQLRAPDASMDFNGMTLAHNTQNRDEVDSILLCAKSAGGEILKPVAETFWGGYSGYFSDPDGYVWEVAYADFWQFDDNGNLVLD